MEGKQYVIQLLKMNTHDFIAELTKTSIGVLRENFRLALLEQDRDTRYACAESVMQAQPSGLHGSAINIRAAEHAVLNCTNGILDIPQKA